MTNGPADPAAKLTSTPVDATALIKFSKGDSGRVIPLNKELIAAIAKRHDQRNASPRVITTERSQCTSARAIVNLFASWYSAAGFHGCSSQ